MAGCCPQEVKELVEGNWRDEWNWERQWDGLWAL